MTDAGAGQAADAGPPAAPPPLPLRHNRCFRMLWIGQVLSDTGTYAAFIAYPLLGLVQAGIAVGGLLGALLAPRLQGRLPLSRLAPALTVIATVLFTAGALVLPSTLVTLPVAITLLLGPTANAALFAAMLRAAPADMRGRVNNTVILAATGLAALSPLTAGLLVEHLSGRWALLAFAAVMAVASALALALPGLRSAEAAGVCPAGTPAETDAAVTEPG